MTTASINEDCQRLLLDLYHHLDHGSPDRAVALFSPDGVWERREGGRSVGRRDIERTLRARPMDRISRHVLTNIRVHTEDQGGARADSLGLIFIGHAAPEGDGALAASPWTGPEKVVEYGTTFRREDGTWLIAWHASTAVVFDATTEPKLTERMHDDQPHRPA